MTNQEVVSAAAGEGHAPPVPESPYRGIESFRYIDQRIFAERAEETWELLSSVVIYRGVLLYGDSGSGKSSLVNAGLLPAALKKNFRPDRLRVQPRRGAELKVERIPEQSPDRPPYLPSSLIEPGSPEDGALTVELSLEEFSARLEKLRPPQRPAPQDNGGGAAAAGAVEEEPPRPAVKPLLIFDQFEEFITLFEEAARGGGAEEAYGVQRDILKTLSRLLEDKELPVKLLLVFREDYLAKLSPLLESRPELFAQYMRLLPPRAAQAAEIIRAPFADAALRERFLAGAPGGRGGEITPRLAGEIAAQLQERSEGGFVNLSELQLVCQQLWESSDPAGFYERAGRSVQKVIEGYWADAFEKLPAELQEPAVAMLGQMVTSAGTRNIVTEEDLKAREAANFAPDLIDRALQALGSRRLIRREPRHKIYFYEIASEFLVPWIQQKQAERLTRVEAARLAAETEAKLAHEQGRKRLFRNAALAAGALLLVAVVACVGLIWAMGRATEAEERIKQAQQALEEQSQQTAIDRARYYAIIQLVIDLTSGDADRRLAAVKSLTEMQKKGELSPGLVLVILDTIGKDENKLVVTAAANLASTTAATNPELTDAIIKATEVNPALASKLPPRAYIKLADEGQRPRAEKIAAALKGMGFAIPPIEVRCCGRNDVRYYDETGGTDPAAVLKAVNATDGGRWRPTSLGRVSTGARPGHFEVWFAKDAQEPMPTPTPATPTPTPATFPYESCRFSRWEFFTAEQVNERLGRPVYAAGTRVLEGELAEGVVLARVHVETDQVGDLLVRPGDIGSLSPEQIKDRYALYYIPRLVSEVRLSAGTRLRVGTVGPRPGLGSGGGVRFHFLGLITRANFPSPPRPLR